MTEPTPTHAPIGANTGTVVDRLQAWADTLHPGPPPADPLLVVTEQQRHDLSALLDDAADRLHDLELTDTAAHPVRFTVHVQRHEIDDHPLHQVGDTWVRIDCLNDVGGQTVSVYATPALAATLPVGAPLVVTITKGEG